MHKHLIAIIFCVLLGTEITNTFFNVYTPNNEVINMPVDLSIPDEYIGKFVLSKDSIHKISFVITLDKEIFIDNEFENQLNKTLELEIIIKDIKGNNIICFNQDEITILTPAEKHKSEELILSLDLHNASPTLPPGEYLFVLNLLKGVDKLSGVSQEISASYLDCTLENFMNILNLFCKSLPLVILLLLLWVFIVRFHKKLKIKDN